MLVCIPTLEDNGPTAPVCGHFGSAPFFTLFDPDRGELKVVDNSNSHHAHGTCHPLAQLGGYGVTAIVTGGIGRRALDTLARADIKVYQSVGSTVQDVIDALGSGGLAELDAAHACGGHSHGSGHGHGTCQL